MWLIAGLGNPGDEYADTRHNAGFMVIDRLAARHSIQLRQKANNYIFGRGFIEEQKVVFIKPFTFMNLSGEAVMAAVRKNEDLEGVLIVHDDLDLEPGIVKIKKSGSAGGHNGIQSIIDRLGSRDFPRVKVGIGRPERMPVERYVLRPFAKKEKPVIEEAIETAADAVADIITKGVTYAQNKYH
ncbi:peptidyl-tRNA hydrolase [bacterium BMS3Abin09]|nr:peptidyl-tRNA hydrolase [bacterium BMS3Abin09]GBE41412.1 peptidyl-tRNA hydrolase [bacterium BMS3Bbin09]HDN95307.1 aminoacyl-tRNA hydrolase [Nitrospirota bacterium]